MQGIELLRTEAGIPVKIQAGFPDGGKGPFLKLVF
jgi:hypothetical protein